ncbi:MAG: DNA polymerase III subunit beta [bacterium]|nr:DNA polymerase III subunit beta [bacterium]
MKITISQPELSRLASMAGNVVPNKSTLPILSTILLNASGEGLSLSATDLDLSIVIKADAEIESHGTVAIPAKRFSDIVRKLDSVDVVLEQKEGSLSISCGRAHFQISTMDAEDFPKLPGTQGVETFVAPSGTFKNMIRRTRFAVSQDLARPSMNGIFMELNSGNITMVATDGHRLSFYKKPEDLQLDNDYGVIIPSKALDQLMRLLPDDGDLEIGIGDNQSFFKTGDIHLFTRLIEGPFPNYQQVVPKGNSKTMSINKDALLVATDRVATLAASLTTRQIKLIIQKDQLALEVANSEIGKAREEIEAAYDEEEMMVGYNATYLLDVLKNMDCEEINFKLDRPDNAGIIEPAELEDGEEYFSLLMPLKLSD